VTGTVRWFNDSKGYGFITLPDGREAFLHYSHIKKEGYKTLASGDKVKFDLYEAGTHRGCMEYEAHSVTKAE